MSRPLQELEQVLRQMIAEHGRLLADLVDHQAAMRVLDVKRMNQVSALEETCRLRIAGLESRRRALTLQLARAAKLEGEPTLRMLAASYPANAESLMALRAELRAAVEAAAAPARIAGRLAAAVLGHLNAALRMLAGAVEKAGLYTKSGVPKLSARVGVMNAVG